MQQSMAYSSSSVSAQWNTLVIVAVLVTSPQLSQVTSHQLGSMHVGYLSVEDDKARNKQPVQ